VRGETHGLLGKPERKIMIGRPIDRWENNIKMVLKEMGCKGVNWIELARGTNLPCALVNMVSAKSDVYILKR
jgi:hypothetical protein